MTKKLIILRGCPGSGKSTYAKKRIAEAQKEGFSAGERNFQAIQRLLQTAGQAEFQRRESARLDHIVSAISRGEEGSQILASLRNLEQTFSPGVAGGLQRLGGAFQPQQGSSIEKVLLDKFMKSKTYHKKSFFDGEELENAYVYFDTFYIKTRNGFIGI